MRQPPRDETTPLEYQYVQQSGSKFRKMVLEKINCSILVSEILNYELSAHWGDSRKRMRFVCHLQAALLELVDRGPLEN